MQALRLQPMVAVMVVVVVVGMLVGLLVRLPELCLHLPSHILGKGC